MRGVNFDDLETAGQGAASRLRKCVRHLPNMTLVHRFRDRTSHVKGQSAGRQDRPPSPLWQIQRRVSLPRTGCRRLAACVRQLNTGDGALPANEGGDSAQHVDLLVLPQTQILRADAPARFHRCGLGEHNAGAADGAAAQVHEMPIAGEAVLARVLTHRRDDDTVLQREAAERKSIEKHRMTVPLRDEFQATRSRGSWPAKYASRLSSARNPIASRVSAVALPMCGIRNVLGRATIL